MNDMTWTNFSGKKVFIIVDTSVGERKYSGVVKEVTLLGKNIDGNENFLILLDDFITKKLVGFSSSQIKLIQEER